ncbi:MULTISPECIES: amino acid adenylation domain-containing protein [Actinosynnema]|uniref:amino acid adenylation domain-containing protein n=1 Tax=Actinosynnema TaxID=40566 RepID=UPI0031DD058B
MVSRCPDRDAVVTEDERVTYRHLDARSDRLARLLRALGAGPRSVVAVLVDKTAADFVTAAVACWKLGAVYVPVDPRIPLPQVERMFAGVEPAVLLGPPELTASYQGMCPATSSFDEPDSGPALSLDAPAEDQVGADDLAYIVHTSGSTGTPKPVAMSHRALVSLYDGWAQCYGLAERAPNWLQAASPAFDVHIGDLARALLSGGTLVLCPTPWLLDPPRLHELLVRESVDSMDLTPTVLRLLASWLTETGWQVPAMRLVICGGEQMTTADFRHFRRGLGPRTRIVNAYGVSEAGVESTLQDVTEETIAEAVGEDDADLVPIGFPLPGAAVAVLDDQLRPVACGEVGELYIGGDRLARGYYHRPDITDERFLPAVPGIAGPKMYRTGDLVRLRPNGAIVFLGRTDDQVKVRGVRVQLSAVEAALLSLPGIAQAAAVRVDRAGEGTLVGHVVPAGDGMTGRGAAEALRAEMAAHVADAMVPAEFIVHERLPLTRSGKVDRKALAAIPLPSSRTDMVPATEAERVVADLWERVLGRPPRGLDDNLFEAGGTSLTAATLVAAVRGETGLDLTVSALFAEPTVAALSRFVATAEAHAEPISAAHPTPDDGPPGPGQYGLWLLRQLRPEDPTYHLPTVLTLTGPLDLVALRRALDLLIERHDALRTGLVAGAGGPVLRTGPPMPFPLEVREGDTDASAAVDEVVRRPFDLSRPPLIRAVLVRHAVDRHELVVVTHHVVFDDWSERILLRDLGELYSAAVEDRPAVLPAKDIGYQDYARWHTGRAESPTRTRQRAYWRHRLADPPAPLDLPSTLGGPAGGRAAVLSRTLPPGSADRVRQVAGMHGMTPYTTLLSALTVLLRRWSGQEDLMIGAPFGDRDRPETQDLVGFLVGTLPLRLSVPAGASFTDVLGSTRHALANARANAEVPYDQVVRDAGLAGTGDPVFRVWFNWLGQPAKSPAMTGLTTGLVRAVPPGALFDLVFYVTDGPAGFELTVVHDEDVLDGAHMSALVDQYVSLVDGLCGRPDVPVLEHPLRTARDGAIGGDDDLRTAVPPLVPTLAASATAFPDAVAVRGDGGTTSYAELFGTAGILSRQLHAAGVAAGDVVPIHAERTPRLVTAVLGVLGAGAAVCVLDAEHPPARLADQLGELTAPVGLRLGDEVPAELRTGRTRWLGVEPAGSALWPMVTGEALAYVAFTSGTTGRPKAVRGGGEPLAHFLSWYTERHGIGAADRFAALSGLGHDPLLRDVLTPLRVGGTLSLPPQRLLRQPVDLLAWLRHESTTVVHVTPGLARMLALPRTVTPAPGIRLVVCGGDELHGADVDRIRRWAPNATVVNAYGTTETPQVASHYEVTGPATPRVPVGNGVPGAELLVVNAAGHPAGIGELGAVVVRSPYLADADDAVWEPDAFPGHRRFVTGDLGRLGPDGLVTVCGRSDGQAQVDGFRVDLAEVDRRLHEHPAVRDAATRAVRREGGGNHLVACVVPRGGMPRPEEVRAFLRTRLPAAAVPSVVVEVTAIPLSPNGKVDRSALPAPRPVAPRSATPATELEHAVSAVWCRVLGVERIDADRNFFDLGATSLTLAAASVALGEDFGTDIPIAALFEHTTVRGLAGYLGARAAESTPTRSRRGASAARERRIRARRG